MKRWLGMVLAAAVLAALLVPASALEVAAPSAILIETSSGRVLWEKDADTRRRPASVTKIMTLLLVMEALENGQFGWDDTVTASSEAVKKGGSQIYLSEGETMTVRDMVKSVVVASANDCACALAEAVCGSEAAFVDKMNERARELGMKDTQFYNCTGLDDGENGAKHLTTARDIALMSRALLEHDEIRSFTGIWMDSVRDGQFGLSNTNKLVRFYEGTTGLKTGYTSAAGHCISASAARDGMELVAVVLGAGSSAERFTDAKTLLGYGFANYALFRPELSQPVTPVRVTLGERTAVTPMLGDGEGILIASSEKGSINCETSLFERVTAPVEKGQVIGTMTVRSGEKTIREVPIVASFSVPKLSLPALAGKLFSQICFCE